MTGTKQIYLVIGCPCSGKSWVCEQLRELYDYVRHDDYMDTNKYLEAIRRKALDEWADAAKARPLLIETPFSMSQLIEPLETKFGFDVTPVFIIEPVGVLRARYQVREGKPIPIGHLSRQDTYLERAMQRQSFFGTSTAVLECLKASAARPTVSKMLPVEKWPWG